MNQIVQFRQGAIFVLNSKLTWNLVQMKGKCKGALMIIRRTIWKTTYDALAAHCKAKPMQPVATLFGELKLHRSKQLQN